MARHGDVSTEAAEVARVQNEEEVDVKPNVATMLNECQPRSVDVSLKDEVVDEQKSRITLTPLDHHIRNFCDT